MARPVAIRDGPRAISNHYSLVNPLFNMYFLFSFLYDYYYSRVTVHCKSIMDNLSEGVHSTKNFGQKSIISCLFCLAKI